MSNDLVEAAFVTALQNALSNTPAFTLAAPKTFQWYTSGETTDFKLPCLSGEMGESAPLHAGTPVSQGTLTIWIETQADDETEAIHKARVDAATNFLRNPPAVCDAINAAGQILVFGFAFIRTARVVKGRTWQTSIDLTVGFGPAAP